MLEKRKKRLYNSNKAKMLIASTIVASAVGGIATLGDVNEAEANTLYYWDQYSVTSSETFHDALNVGSPLGGNQITEIINSYKQSTGHPNFTHKQFHVNDHTGSYVQYQFFKVFYNKNTKIKTITAHSNAYLDNAYNAADGFWYVLGARVNAAPTIPTLTVPTMQFEHGDKHIIGWNATDPNGDTITYTLQASYNGGAWEDLYNGTAKSYTYTVPNNKGASVKFRVIASDSSLTSTSSESSVKSIREVMYFWSKYNTALQKNYIEDNWYNEGNENGGVLFESTHRGYVFDPNTGQFSTTGGTLGVWKYPVGTVGYSSSGNTIWKYTVLQEGLGVYQVETKRSWLISNEVRGSLITNSLQDNYNKYNHNVKNADGFWYMRGQRVLSEDVTPPIIELEEQAEYGETSSVTVKTHDLSTVQKVKWASGEQDVAYFASNGTSIGVGQSTPSSFTVSNNGIYTVYAEDNKGNKAVQTIEVKKVNLPPEIQTISTAKFNIVDNTTSISLKGTYYDREDNEVSVTVTTNGQNSGSGSGAEGVFTATANGTNLDNGVHENPFTIKLNDGSADSENRPTTEHTVIKVSDASDYSEDFITHVQAGSVDADTLTKSQHQAFYNAYVALQAYETGRTQVQYDEAVALIDTMKSATGVGKSGTIDKWNERLAMVLTTVALEKGENTLAKVDYEHALSLFNALTLASNKSLIQDRLEELRKYHVVNDLLEPMESEVVRHKANTATALETTIINVENFNQVKAEIAKTANTDEANYKTNLNTRYNTLRNYYLNNKAGLTPEDLTELAPNVDPTLSGEYDELKDAFGDLGTNAQHLVNYTNAVMKFLYHVNGPTKDEYHAVVASFPTDTGIDFSKLGTISTVIDNLHAFRSAFRENAPGISAIAQDIANATTGGTLVKGYMEQVRIVMKEVTEYNDVELDEEHSETERHEAESLIPLLKAGQFQTDMTEYVMNEIPIVMIDSNPYEYIVNGEVVVTGEITDNNNHEHTVTVNLGTETLSQTTANKQFSITLNRPEGVYLNETLIINVNDGLTNKAVTIHNKPIVSVSNPQLFTEMVKLLEEDRNEAIVNMSNATLNELIWIMNQMVSATIHTSPLSMRQVYQRTENLSTQHEGQLEQFVKQYVQANYLQWLYDNYLTATVDDFEFAGVLKDGQKFVTYENITDLKILITDYINSYAPSIAPVPKVEDYILWVNMLDSVELLDQEIEEIYKLVVHSEVTDAIDTITQKINDTIPSWTSIYPAFNPKLDKLKDFEIAITGVEKAEKSVTQDDLDAAQILVNAVGHVDAKNSLQGRLDNLQVILDAITEALQAVILAENKLADNDNEAANLAASQAQGLVDLLSDETVKTELQERIDEVNAVIKARQSIEKIENEVLTLSILDAQNKVDSIKTLVNAVKSQTERDALNGRIDEVQDIIDAKQAIEVAAQAIVEENKALIAQALLDAQTKIDAVDTPLAKQELQKQFDNLEQLATALQSVITAEEKEEQIEIDSATLLVEALPSNSVKEGLANRLVEVQKVVDGKNAVADAEVSFSQTDYDSAVTKVNEIHDGKETKITLKLRLANVLKVIDAQNVVKKAEDEILLGAATDAQNLINTAQVSVDAVQNATEKSKLENRILELQHIVDARFSIEHATNELLTENQQGIQQAVAQAQAKIDLVTNATVKADLQKQLDNLESIAGALQAVIEAETTEAQAEKDIAQTLVQALTDNNTKDTLTARLVEVQKVIDGKSAVTDAEVTFTRADYNNAVDKVNAISDTKSSKLDLKNRLAEVVKVIEATDAVEKAENEVLTVSVEDAEVNVNNAQTLVDTVTVAAQKDGLEARLTEVQEILDARNAIGAVVEVMASEDNARISQAIANAQAKIDLVDTTLAKQSLQEQLDNLDTFYDAIVAVLAAEQAEEQVTKDHAQLLIDSLLTSSHTSDLENRLLEVQKVIDGKTAVTLVEKTLIRSDYEKAVSAVAIIHDAKTTKVILETRLEIVLQLIEAIEQVELAETSESQVERDKAQGLVDALPDGPKKDELNERLEDVQEAIDKKSAEDKATEAVEYAEETWNPNDIQNAQDLIDALTDETVKELLQERLDKVKELVDLYNQAEDAIAKAEEEKTTGNVTDAQKAIDDLVTLVGGSNEKTDALQDRLDKVNDYVIAEKAVERAESLLTQGAKDAAQQKVDVLEPSAEKDTLQDRLDKLQEIIDGKGTDLLDKIIDNPQDVTGEELAEYVEPEIVYEELLHDYRDALENLVENNDVVTKDDVINIIRFINSLALAKREMTAQTIQAYNTEYNVVKAKLSMSEYPAPVFLETIEQYVDDESVLSNLISIIGSETGMSEAQILEVIANMQVVKEEIQYGSYTIEYVNEAGELIHKEAFTNVPFGEVTLLPVLEGYEIVESETDITSFELTEDTNEKVFTFVVKKIEESAEIGSYTIEYVDEAGNLIHQEKFTDIPFGEITLTPSLEGYEVIESETNVTSFELAEDTDGKVFIFTVKALEMGEESEENPEDEVEPVEDEEAAEEETEPSDKEEIVEDGAEPAETEEIVEEETEPVETEGNVKGESEAISETSEPASNEELTPIESDVNQAQYKTVKIANLGNGLILTATTNVFDDGLVISKEHARYFTQAFLSLEGVKTVGKQGAAVTEEYHEKVKSYIVSSLLDGAYKEMLLAQLGIQIGDIGNGNDGIPDLTPIIPVKPELPVKPPVIIPVEPTPVEPTEPGIIIRPVEPSGPIYVPTIPVEEIKKPDNEKGEQVIGDLVIGKDGSLSLHVDNPSQTEYELKGTDTTIHLQLEELIVKDLETLDIRWLYQGTDHFKLEVYGDGEKIEAFKAKLNVSYKKDYLVEKVGTGYTALPYQKTANTFSFNLFSEETVYFHSNKPKFKDIHKFTDRKDMIEELAGRHIVFGESETRFNPNGKVTRAQLASMITRALNLDVSDKATPFTDTVGKWYEKDVQALYEAGMISGTGSSSFAGDQVLTRQQAALMLNQVLEKRANAGILQTAVNGENNSYAKLPTFADRGKIADNAILAVARLENAGIVTGDAGYFNPQSDLTRAQIAKMLVGVLKLTGNM